MELGKRQLTSREEVKFMSEYNVVMLTAESTVVTEYEPQQTRSDAYQSEAALENAFIKMLTEQGYQYLKIDSPSALIDNLRHQLEKLNNYSFSDREWKQFFENKIANSNEGIVEKTRKIQEDHIQVLRRDDGSSKNIYLIDKANIHNNSLQVINQYVEEGGAHDTRYDVTILVNGLPLVHIELKRRGVPIKEAFNQIERYQRDSFWAGCGLYEYVQVFVISNGTNTKYYSNTTRNAHIKEQNGNPDVLASKIASRIAGHEVTVRFPIIELLRAVQKKKEENAQKQQNNASESQIALLVAKDETTDNWFEAVLKALCIAIEVDTITRIFEAIFKSVNPNFNWNDWYDSLSEFNKKLINDFSLFGAAFLNHLYVDVLEMKDFKNVSNALSDFFSQKNFEKITELVIDKLTYSERGAGYVAIWMSFTDAFNGYNDGTYTGFQSVMLMGFDLITMVMAASGSGAFAVIMPIIAREVVLFGIKFDNGHYWG